MTAPMGALPLPDTDTIVADLRAVGDTLDRMAEEINDARDSLAVSIGAVIATAQRQDAGGRS